MEQMFRQCTEMMNGMMGGTMMNGMLLFWLLAAVAVVLLMILVWKIFTTNNFVAVNILQERFARGEIDREEYQSRRSILKHRR